MRENRSQHGDDVDQLMLNAQLRNELEPFFDESVNLVDMHRMTTRRENEFLASMLAWERAPVLPIAQWFNPTLSIPSPDQLSEDELQVVLDETIERLYDVRIVLEFTEHLSDRQLYTLIFRDILPSPEKKVDLPRNFLHWHCIDIEDDFENWLRYYATGDERDAWSDEHGTLPPIQEEPPYPRVMPRRPQA